MLRRYFGQCLLQLFDVCGHQFIWFLQYFGYVSFRGCKRSPSLSWKWYFLNVKKSDLLFLQIFHECFLNPCQNKGTCEEVGAGYVCTCMPGFTGKTPDRLNCCSCSYCKQCCYSAVTWLIFSLESACEFCPSGAKCEIDINECDSAPCQNGGLCKDGMGDFQCQCKPGFLGREN